MDRSNGFLLEVASIEQAHDIGAESEIRKIFRWENESAWTNGVMITSGVGFLIDSDGRFQNSFTADVRARMANFSFSFHFYNERQFRLFDLTMPSIQLPRGIHNIPRVAYPNEQTGSHPYIRYDWDRIRYVGYSGSGNFDTGS